jgi:hypothetical protein
MANLRYYLALGWLYDKEVAGNYAKFNAKDAETGKRSVV